MPIVTPKTNFIDLLEDLSDFLSEVTLSSSYDDETADNLCIRVNRALEELKDLKDEFYE